MYFRVSPPFEHTARLRAEMSINPLWAGLYSELSSEEVSLCEELLTLARTHFAQQPPETGPLATIDNKLL